MKTLYITDLDGTFLNSKGRVSDFSRELINKMTEEGLLFSAATARSPVTSAPILEGLNLKTPCVLMNGVFVYDMAEKKYIHLSEIKTSCAEKAIEIFKKHAQEPFMYVFENDDIGVEYTSLGVKAQKEFYDERKTQYSRFEKVPFLSPKGKRVIYFADHTDYKKGKPLFDEISALPGVSAVFYEDTYCDCWYLEVFSDEASKPRGMEFIKEYVKAEKTVAFGDNLNDLAMMAKADFSVAVKNAKDRVKKAADKIIGTNDEDAVAKEIAKMFYGE